jgi:hypothetical protein
MGDLLTRTRSASHRQAKRAGLLRHLVSGADRYRLAPPLLAFTCENPDGLPRSGRVAERTRQRHAAIHDLLAAGRSVSAITAEPGLARLGTQSAGSPAPPRIRPSLCSDAGYDNVFLSCHQSHVAGVAAHDSDLVSRC